MLPEIRSTPFELTLHGHALRHDPAKSFGQEIIALLDRVWPVLKSKNLPHDGLNRVVYPGDGTVFAGVVLTPPVADAAGLDQKTFRLPRHAAWTHIGPYHLIPATCAAMKKTLEAQGLRFGSPMIETYGHWTPDESKLETQTLVAII